jgi:RNA polymerase sigma-70 factor (ECF subfamily)
LPRLPRHEFDQDYVERLVAEDPETEQHFTRYFGELLSLKLRSRLKSASLVEDAKQETFVRVLSTLKEKGGLNSPGSLGAFVNTVCNHVLFEMYRSGSRITPLEEDAAHEIEESRASAETTLLAAEEHDRVRLALAGLPAKEQELLKWLFFDERSKDDICRELRVDRDYLRVLLHRAKARFRERFQEEAG